MYKIANFNSLWEIGFAINIIFVYFELQPFLEKKFINIQTIGKEIIDRFIIEKHRHNINISGLRGLTFGYVIWVHRLKYLSIFNSLLSIALICIGGYNPEAEFGVSLSTLIIVLIFAPTTVIPMIILFFLPILKIESIENSITRIIESNKDTHELSDENVKQYKAVLEYIKFRAFPFLYLIKKNESMPIEEVFSILHNSKNN